MRPGEGAQRTEREGQSANQGAEVVGNTPEQHDAFNKGEIAKWIRWRAPRQLQPSKEEP
jgi:hypothetical protein